MVSGSEILQAFATIQKTHFATILQALLDETGVSKSELHAYLLERGFEIEKTSLYRYFNGNRIPDEDFLNHFCDFLALPRTQAQALQGLWEAKRSRKRNNPIRPIPQ